MRNRCAFFIMLPCLLLGSAIWTGGSTAERTITLEAERLSVSVPDGWERGAPAKGYSLLLGRVEPDTGFRANLTLMVTHIPGLSSASFTLDDLFRSSKDNLDKTLQSNYSDLQQSRMTVLGQEILVVQYDVLNEKATMRCRQHFVFRGENRYLFTSVATKKNFAKHEADFDSVVGSLRFF